MNTVQNVDIKALMAKAKNHNAAELAAAKQQIEEQKSKQLIAQLAANLQNVSQRVDEAVNALRRARKIAKLEETRLQSYANAAAAFEETGDFAAFEKARLKANSTYSNKYYKI